MTSAGQHTLKWCLEKMMQEDCNTHRNRQKDDKNPYPFQATLVAPNTPRLSQEKQWLMHEIEFE
jgi:hypothetical protein